MKISLARISMFLIGLCIWGFFLMIFPTAWAMITIFFGISQLAKCQKKSTLIQKLFLARTCDSSLTKTPSRSEI